jgi:hypothetical protein
MINVSIVVGNGASRFSVAVRAESIQRAVSLVAGRHPDRDYRMMFPIDPETFFEKDPAVRPRIVVFERPFPIAT